MLGDVAARIEARRLFCWKTAHHTDQHDHHGEMIGAMCKVHRTDLRFVAVLKCMQVVAVNSVDRTLLFGKYLREATIRTPLSCPRGGRDIGELSEARGASCRAERRRGADLQTYRPASRPKSSSDR